MSHSPLSDIAPDLIFDIGRDVVPTLGVIALPLMLIGDTVYKTLDCHSIMAEFVMLDLPSAFNAIVETSHDDPSKLKDWPILSLNYLYFH